MNSIAQAAPKRARSPTAVPIPVRALDGARQQARAEATATVFALRDTLRAANGVALVVEQLKRTAEGRPASHIAGYLDIIQLLEQGQ